MRRITLASSGLLLAALVAGSCSGDDAPVAPVIDAGLDTNEIADVVHERTPYIPDTGTSVPRVPVHSETVSTRVDTQSLLFAAGEMQISGEPFAAGFAGRNLADYDRNRIPPDQYVLNLGASNEVVVNDPFGFSTAVESYEYSKYHMNIVVEQTTAGLSLADGPVVALSTGTTTLDKLRTRAAELMTAASTDISGYATLPAPPNNPLNYLGFAGVWPVLAPFKSFDSVLAPATNVIKSCTFSGGYGGTGFGTKFSPQYECVYNSLHLPNRNAQVDKTIVPAVLGFATWKEALWAIDFAGRIHDTGNNQVNTVDPGDVSQIGVRGNSVRATDPSNALNGTYIGSSPLEGMWGLFMLAMMDNESEWVLSSLMTKNGSTLGGFGNKAQAIAYDYTSPLMWLPAATTVVEDETVVPYPAIASLSIADATSRSVDLSAMLLGHAMFFGMTDPRNAGVGQRIGLQASFDGDPFAADNGLADGENTAHDRALGVLRVAFIDLDRMHADPTLGVLMDTATVNGQVVTRGNTVSTTTLAHAVIALRQTLLSINGSITQYGAPDPDPTADTKGILNSSPINPGGAPQTFSARVRQVFTQNATFVRDVLTKADGTVANAATVTNKVATPTNDPATLESQSAAIRALVEGFLVTGDESFRTRARAVAKHLESGFYSLPARMYRATDGGPDQIHLTPERFGWLQSALRETHKTLDAPNDATLDRSVLEGRIARMHKLFLNGWDDLNGDQAVDLTTECLGGRLQMAEQALTGELGRDANGVLVGDRDGDCVIELAHAKNASVLASDVYFHSP